MQEFTSISVSSYEAGSLADRLTEQANEGWSVVAIVPTGNSITAYLSRAATGAEAATPAAVVAEPAAESAAEPVAEPAEEAAGAAEEPPTDAEEAPAGPTPDDLDIGWEVTPEPATTPGGGTADDDIAALAAQLGQDDTATAPASPAAEPAVAAAAEAAAHAEATTAATSAAATTQAAAASAAPAGWYADPSSRFELRYWDGAQWTEHVSRAGQQYTDPPVA